MKRMNNTRQIRSWPVYPSQIAAVLAAEAIGPTARDDFGNLKVDDWINDYNKIHEAIYQSALKS